jgi:hypothetical protein
LAGTNARLALLTLPCQAFVQYSNVWINGVLRDYAREHAPEVSLVDFDQFVCPGGIPHQVDGKPMLRFGHLTVESVPVVWDYLAKVTDDLVPTTPTASTPRDS